MDELPEVLTRAQQDVEATQGVVAMGLASSVVGRDVAGALQRAGTYLEECQHILFSGAATPAMIARITTSASELMDMLRELRSSLAGEVGETTPFGFMIDTFLTSNSEHLVEDMQRKIEADGPPSPDEPPSTFDHLLSESTENLIDFIRDQERIDRERSYMAEIESLRATASVAAQEAAHSAELAAQAAGVTGIASESRALADYARKQLRAAEFFRWSAAMVILATLIAAIIIEHPTGDDIAGAIYRVAILAGAAGLATYFGRQSAMHRRNGNWASALQVQLRTFPALAESIRDEGLKARLFESFAQRLLLSAPEHGKPASDDTASVQSLLEAILRRLPSSGS